MLRPAPGVVSVIHLVQQRPGVAGQVRGHGGALRFQAQAAPALPVGADPQVADELARHRVLQTCSTLVEHVWRTSSNKRPTGQAARAGRCRNRPASGTRGARVLTPVKVQCSPPSPCSPPSGAVRGSGWLRASLDLRCAPRRTQGRRDEERPDTSTPPGGRTRNWYLAHSQRSCWALSHRPGRKSLSHIGAERGWVESGTVRQPPRS